MSRKFITNNFLVATFLVLALAFVGVGPDALTLAHNASANKASASSAQREVGSIAKRIQRVENGLLLPVSIKGQPITEMRLADRMRFYDVPGVSVAVINNLSIEWARAYGVKEAGGTEPVNLETLFQAASISKPVVATATLSLVQQGKLSLDEEVNKKLASWKIPDNQFTKEKQVTLRHLLSHTAGLTNHAVGTYTLEQPLPTLTEALDGKPPSRPRPVRVDSVPGSRWRYSGGGYSVLQQLLIDVTEKPFPAFLHEAVLEPLGMKHSFYQQPLSKELNAFTAAGHRFDGAMVKGRWMVLPEMAAGGLWSTPSDIALFVVELQKSLAGRSNKILSAEMMKQMLTPQAASMGLGITVEGRGPSIHFSHGGSNPGYRCFMVGYGETGQGAVVMTNSDLGRDLLKEILRGIAREYQWPDYHPVLRETISVDPKIFQAYVGQYEYDPGRTITVTSENGRLFAQDNREFRSEIFPMSQTAYFSILYNTEFKFVTNEKGQATEIIVRWAGDEEDVRAKKTK